MIRDCMPVVMLGLLSTAALAQEQAPPHPGPPFVRASGEAVVSEKPDRATLDIGVINQAQTAQEAAAQNARQLEAAMQEIRKALGPAAELKTVGYSVQPEYRYPQGGGQPKITGYSAHNTLRVTLNDPALAGKAIDVATQSGANTIAGVQFSLKDESGAQARALREATAKAKEKAEAMAQALGVRVVRVLSAVESATNIVRPLGNLPMMARAAVTPPTPVESGTVEIHANVTVTLEVSQ